MAAERPVADGKGCRHVASSRPRSISNAGRRKVNWPGAQSWPARGSGVEVCNCDARYRRGGGLAVIGPEDLGSDVIWNQGERRWRTFVAPTTALMMLAPVAGAVWTQAAELFG
jgi:hypothetical protein